MNKFELKNILAHYCTYTRIYVIFNDYTLYITQSEHFRYILYFNIQFFLLLLLLIFNKFNFDNLAISTFFRKKFYNVYINLQYL